MPLAPCALDIDALTDVNLLDLYRIEGDQSAFAEIVRRYAGSVFTTAVRILNNRARADDVSQETFFRLSQKPHAVKQSLGGWLHTAATRLAIDVLRSEHSRAGREAAYTPKPPSKVTQWSEVSPHVDQALAEMPADQRNLLVRHFLQGKSQCILASELGTSPATISRRIKAGVDALRERLSKKGIVLPAALLLTLLREHGSAVHAAPATLLSELGKITMLSGGNNAAGATVPLAGAPLAPAGVCGFWWICAITTLVIGFAVLVGMAQFTLAQRFAPAAPATMPDHPAPATQSR